MNKIKTIIPFLPAAIVCFVGVIIFFVFLANGFSFSRDFSGMDQFVEKQYKAVVLSKNTALFGYETRYLLCQEGRVMSVKIDKTVWKEWVVMSEKFLPNSVYCSH